MRAGLIVLWMVLCSMTSAVAQVSIGIGLPNVSIGINLPLYPELVPVPGYPVYYAPRMEANYFFYDGMYWVYQGDTWYASSWYNGPWWVARPEVVPVFVLRIPVGYYRRPPVYFRGWRPDAPPRWGEHWGRDWEQRRRNHLAVSGKGRRKVAAEMRSEAVNATGNATGAWLIAPRAGLTTGIRRAADHASGSQRRLRK